MRFFGWKLTPENWKSAIAFIIVYGYGYQLVFWPLAFWVTTIATAASGHQVPAPPIIPWEQLGAATVTLGTVGGIETWREGKRAERGRLLAETGNDG